MVEGHTFCQGRRLSLETPRLVATQTHQKSCKAFSVFCLFSLAGEFKLGFFSLFLFWIGFSCVYVFWGFFLDNVCNFLKLEIKKAALSEFSSSKKEHYNFIIISHMTSEVYKSQVYLPKQTLIFMCFFISKMLNAVLYSKHLQPSCQLRRNYWIWQVIQKNKLSSDIRVPKSHWTLLGQSPNRVTRVSAKTPPGVFQVNWPQTSH